MSKGTSRVGLIGIGMIGQLIATKLKDRGLQIVGFDPAPRAQEWAAEHGIEAVASPAMVADRVDICLLSLPGPAQVRQVLLGPVGVLEGQSVKVIVDLTTSEPNTTRELALESSKRGVGLIDAPILGRPRSVGRWVLPVGGDEAVLRMSTGVLEMFAGKIHHVGPSGSGHAFKLLNMLMFGAINAVTAEVMVLSKQVGLDPHAFYEVLVESEAATVSGLFREIGPKILERNFAPIFTLDLLSKDIALAVQMCESSGAPSMVGSLVKVINQYGQAEGFGANDTSAVALVFERLSAPADAN